MSFEFSQILWLFYAFCILNGIAILAFALGYYNDFRGKRLNDQVELFLSETIEPIADVDLSKYPFLRSRSRVLRKYIELRQGFTLNATALKRIHRFFHAQKWDVFYQKRLSSLIRHRRVEAAAFLTYMATRQTIKSLKRAILKEPHYSVKLVYANALADIGDETCLAYLLKTYINAPRWYQDRIQSLFYQFDESFFQFSRRIRARNNPEIVRLILQFAKVYISLELKQYCLEKANGSDDELAELAVEALFELYTDSLIATGFLNHSNPRIRGYALKATLVVNGASKFQDVLDALDDPLVEEDLVEALSLLLRKNPSLFKPLIDIYQKETRENRKEVLIRIISTRLDYYLINLVGQNLEWLKSIVEDVMLSGNINTLIGFLNRNRNREVENEVLAIVKDVLPRNASVAAEFSEYLKDRILQKLDLSRPEKKQEKRQDHRNQFQVFALILIVVFALTVMPVQFLCRHWAQLGGASYIEILKQFVIEFNFFLAFYSLSINSIYLLILGLSFLGAYKQKRFWQIKQLTTLFKKKMLPSISILAPAYNEEAGIIESTSSLLNLRYPNYEVVVINDGSKDNTLNELIDYFQLERIDYNFEPLLNTQPVRGIYKNPMYPKLVVVDKTNGGKADSLNVGINIAQNDYFCGIDADSLLESEALLKMVSQMLDYDKECIASGGNILPINGCSVHRGKPGEIRLPENRLARFQTIEYLRAFMAGRVGWSFMNGLLIISGAFGLFHRQYVIETGGYLTVSGKFGRDTVGEDMEMVVRIRRWLTEQKIPNHVLYACNANCWTEVPENFSMLKRQRDRWHRGLLDILYLHRSMNWNPRYGVIGLLSLPYFLIFECVGPFFELQGYLMVVFAGILGLLNPTITLLLFVSTIMMGLLISLSSLVIAGKIARLFSFKDNMILMSYAFLENFGFRQIMSFFRIYGHLSALSAPKGWGEMKRKGFSKKQ